MAGADLEDEKEWVIRLKKGEKDAFDFLYRRYERRIYYNLKRLVYSEEAAGELHQEVFVRIWERRLAIDPEKPFGAYVARIAYNLAMDFYRQAANDELLREQLSLSATSEYDPEAEDTESRRYEWMMDTISKLPPQRKKVFTLCKLEGQSYQHIATLLGVSIGTIKDHMTKASRFLKQEMTNTDLHILLIILFLY